MTGRLELGESEWPGAWGNDEEDADMGTKGRKIVRKPKKQVLEKKAQKSEQKKK